MILAQATDLALPKVEYSALSPMLSLIVGALVILLVSSLVGRRLPEWVWTAMSSSAHSSAAAVRSGCGTTSPTKGLGSAWQRPSRVDGFSVWFAIAMCVFVALFSLLAGSYVERERLGGPEIHVLALLSASGGILMAFANDLIVLFLGLEILSIALYVLAGFHRRRAESGEAAIKYFVLGAFASAVFLYGVALVYGATGSTRLDQIVGFLTGRTAAAEGAGVESDERRLLLMGVVLLLVGLGFKVAAVPFHTWTPDVYQGVPLARDRVHGRRREGRRLRRPPAGVRRRPVAGQRRLAPRGLRDGHPHARRRVGARHRPDRREADARLQLHQPRRLRARRRLRREPGRSRRLRVLPASPTGSPHSAASPSSRSWAGKATGHHSLDDYKGLYQRRPTLAVAFALLLAAQAGVPFTTGFLAKFSVIRAATDSDDYALAIIAMLVTAIAAFFYLRLVLTMFTPADEEADEAEGGGAVALAVRAKAKAELEIPVGTAIVVGFSVL